MIVTLPVLLRIEAPLQFGAATDFEVAKRKQLLFTVPNVDKVLTWDATIQAVGYESALARGVVFSEVNEEDANACSVLGMNGT